MTKSRGSRARKPAEAPIAEVTLVRAVTDALPELRRVEAVVRSYLQFMCDGISLSKGETDWYRLAGESRIKEADRVHDSLKRQGLSVDEWRTVDDIVGVRAVVLTLSDAEYLAEVIVADKDRYPFDTLEVKRVAQADGYRAIHLKGRVAIRNASVGCEIQIRTALQDAWAVVSRGGLYGEEESSFVSETATYLSEQLAGSDRQLDLIRRTLHRPEPIKAKIQSKSSSEIA